MKKLLSILSTVTLTVGSIVPFVNHTLLTPSLTVIKKIKYSYDFKNLDWTNIKFENVNGIQKAELSSEMFTKALIDCIQEMYDAIPEKESNVYSIKKITTHFNVIGSANNDLEAFNEKFIKANKDVDKLSIVDHKLIIEKYNDPKIGEKYYVNVFAKISEQEMRLYGGDASKGYNSLNDIKNIFTNEFEVEIIMEVWIDGWDSQHKEGGGEEGWNIKLPQNIDFQIKSQIINWFMMNEQEGIRDEVLAHINKIKDTQITKIDRPSKLYKAILNEEKRSFEPGEEFTDNFLIGKEYPYFYIGITSKEQAWGEFKILVKNTKGPDETEPIEFKSKT